MSNGKHIIALAGYAGTGKDTVADLLVAHRGFRKLAFADALRAEVVEAFGVDPAHLVHPVTKNHPMSALAMRRAPIAFVVSVWLATEPGRDQRVPTAWLEQPRTPRQILQWWGTEHRRAQDANYWERRLVRRVTQHLREGERRFVIADCRYPNEANAVRVLGGQVWQVTRPGIDGATTAEGGHASANDGSAFRPEVVISNRHDIGHLQQLVLAEFAGRERTACAGAMP